MTIGNKVASGAAWMVALRLSVRTIGVVSTLVLVRLLEPADFGIVAMAMSIYAVIELLTVFGFDVALIQNQDAGPDEYNTAWTLNVILGLLAATVLVAVAGPAASFYDEPQLSTVIVVLALSAVFQGFENIGLVDFRKHLTFDKEFNFRLIIKVLAFVVTITIAFLYQTYWALIAGIVVSKATSLLLSFVMHPFRPRLSIKAGRSILNFSKWLFINNIIYFLRYRAPDFIVGKISGATGLGIFTVSYEISNLPTTELIAPINRALLPGLSKLTKTYAKMLAGLVTAAQTLALISLPAGAGIAATAELLVPLLLGEKWREAIPLVEHLALFGAVAAVQSPIGTALLAAGKPSTLTFLSALNIVITIPATIYLTTIQGPVGAARALLGTALLFLPLTYFVASRALGMRTTDILTILLRPLLGTAIMYSAVAAILQIYFDPASPAIEQLGVLLATVITGVIVYLIAIAIMWTYVGRPAGAERYIVDHFLGRSKGVPRQ